MSDFLSDRTAWQESMNGVTIDCSLDIAVHPVETDTILLTIPGVDGSVNGYEDKYIRMVEAFQQKRGSAGVRIANPFITSHHWESNPRQGLEYIHRHLEEITGRTSSVEIAVVAHSAGAAIIARIAHEYPDITRLLLINPAKKLLSSGDMPRALGPLVRNTTVVFGGEDPSVDMADELREGGIDVQIIDGADHNFSGEYLVRFIGLAAEFL